MAKKKHKPLNTLRHECLVCGQTTEVTGHPGPHDIYIRSIDDCADSKCRKDLARMQRALKAEFWHTLEISDRTISDVIRIARIWSDMAAVCRYLEDLDPEYMPGDEPVEYDPLTALGLWNDNKQMNLEKCLYAAKYHPCLSNT